MLFMNERPSAIYIEEDPSNPPYADAIAKVIGTKTPNTDTLRSESGSSVNGIQVRIAGRKDIMTVALANTQQGVVAIIDADSASYEIAEADASSMAAQGHTVLLLTSARAPSIVTVNGENNNVVPEWLDPDSCLTYVNKFEFMKAPTIKALKALLTPPPAEDTV